MPRLQRRSFAEPENVRKFPHGSVKTISLGEFIIGEFLFEPGWRWSAAVKPIAGTPSCQVRHIGYAVSGHLHVEMSDGTTADIKAGDAYEIPPGHDAWVVGDETYRGVEFSGARTFAIPPEEIGGGVVATLLFTDIVGSTATQDRVGDARWRDLILEHNAAMREELDRHRGRELSTTGDGFLAMFDSASRAVRCGMAMARASSESELNIRVGCHTGEVEFVGGEARGVAVHVAARVLGLAGAGEVYVSGTTRDLLAGSGIGVQSAGSHELKGLTGLREVFRIVGS